MTGHNNKSPISRLFGFKYQKDLEYTLKKRDPFRLAFICEKRFGIPNNLLKYSAVIAESLNYKWIICANPFSISLDQTDWYQVKCEMESFTPTRVNEPLNPGYLFRAHVKFPDSTRTKEKQDNLTSDIPSVVKTVSCINPFKLADEKGLYESIFATTEEQNSFQMRYGMEILSGAVFHPEKLESNLKNLVTTKAMNFIKQETRKAIKTIIKKRSKWMTKIKAEISTQSLEKRWKFTMGDTGLKIDQYFPERQKINKIIDNHNTNPKKRKRMS